MWNGLGMCLVKESQILKSNISYLLINAPFYENKRNHIISGWILRVT